MAVIPISEAVAVQLRQRGVLLPAPADCDIPDEWLALLEQMNGGGEPLRRGQAVRWRPPASS